ncbi:ESCRT-III subunit protein snf7 [Coemansia erecta]|uniref:Vacuolar-sorting protein SNF7 n=1 Tax=Coemansia asiatica TaxID=1052880 RepID=A0A9W7XGH3_9FUNG|nr:ESCRT-III subunit protein snf7 [Coemansia asiatica]KAJ2857436.1 ESCRT-III subunit protein snf7 [Coemansia erecta]KAJ2887407.1 ESCRT-III subunit protein snf7 [Coemansia asiatica]
MKLFFGGNKANKATPKEAVVSLRENIAMLEKREAHLQSKMENEEKIARANVTKNKRVALAALKRKKILQEQLDKMMGSRMTIETQVMAIEAANINMETFTAMKLGTEAMKNIHKKLDIDKVEDTLDDMEEQMELANGVSEAISQPKLFGAELDEDELNAELEGLEQEELDKQLLNAEAAPVALPRVPAARVHNQQAVSSPVRQSAHNKEDEEDEDDELAELRESMGMAA